MSVGEMDRLCEAGDHGVQKQVDRELHQQRSRDWSAHDGLLAHRLEQRANLLNGRALARQHCHQLPSLGGPPRAGDRSFDIAASRGTNVGFKLARVAGRGRAHVDDRVLRDVHAEDRRATTEDGVDRGTSTSIRITTPVRLKTSAGLPATLAPAARNGSLLSGERFQTTSAVPAWTRLRAMGRSMTPRPMKPASIAADIS